MKALTKTHLNELSRMVNAWDPLGLIAGGAPADEYGCLADKVASALMTEVSQENIEELLLIAIIEHFCSDRAEAAKMRPSIRAFVQKARLWLAGLEKEGA